MLSYLARAIRLSIVISSHQCSILYEDPTLSQEKDVKRIVKYLIDTKHVGTEAIVDLSKEFFGFADSDFANG